MEYKDIERLLEEKAAKEQRSENFKDAIKEREELERKLRTILSNRVHDLHSNLKAIYSDLSSYGFGEFEAAINLMALVMWEKKYPHLKESLNSIKTRLAEIGSQEAESIVAAESKVTASSFGVATKTPYELSSVIVNAQHTEN